MIVVEHIRGMWSSLRMRLLAVLLVSTVLLPGSAAVGIAQALPPSRCDWSDQSYDDFYSPPDLGVLTPDRLGEVLRVEHIGTYRPAEVAIASGLLRSPYGAEAYRILYLSQAPAGTPQAVSGLLVVPTGQVPEGGFPIIAHGHPTTGLADSCAPSKNALSVWPLLSWVGRGYLVSATDYVGLGTPGLHPYVVGEAEAFSMLDGARAALRFCDSAHDIAAANAANRIIFEGHSQGGHAALFAHQEWQSYAPELNVLGTVAFAPGSEGRLLAQRMVNGRSMLVGPGTLAMYAYSQYYGAPEDIHTWLKEPYATELPDRVETQCVLGLSLWLGLKADRVFQPDLLAAVREGRWQDMQPWTDYMDINTPGNFASDAPVLIVQGEADPLITPEASQRLTQRLCEHGTSAKLSLYPGVGHIGIARVGQPEALQWIADRLNGVPAPDGCPTP
jgi:acetyl esterase/lipase